MKSKTLGLFVYLATYAAVSAIAAPRAQTGKEAETPATKEANAPTVKEQAKSGTGKNAAKFAKAKEPASNSTYSSNPEQFLYEYFLSEIASQRGQSPIAFRGIFDLAQSTRDARLARRAVEVAFQAGQIDQAREATIFWLDLEPTSMVARQILGRMAGANLDASKASFASWLGLGSGQPLVPVVVTKATPGLLMQIPLVLARQTERDGEKAKYLAAVRELTKPFPQLAEAHFAVAQTALISGNHAEAATAIDEAIRLRPDWPQAAILKSQILRETKPVANLEGGVGSRSSQNSDNRAEGRAEQNALNYLQSFLKTHPGATDVRLIYARLLVAQKSYLSAREEFQKIDRDNVLKKISDPETPYAIALISQQIEDYREAEIQFQRTLEAKPRDNNPVYFNLGIVAEAKKDADAAIAWYRRVGEGEYFVNAKLKTASLLAKREGLEAGRKYLRDARAADDVESDGGAVNNGDNAGGVDVSTSQVQLVNRQSARLTQHIQLVLAESQLLRDAAAYREAFQLLDEAVKKNPDSLELIYDRGMMAEKLDKVDVLEADMRSVISLKPNYAQAYNALGYTLAERNVRLDEAYQLIQKALSITPDDPFIQDSLGWVQFRMGRVDDALATLRKVYKVRRDPEIAAHLGEVLWAAGQRDEAQKLLREASQESPGHEALAALTNLIAKQAVQTTK